MVVVASVVSIASVVGVGYLGRAMSVGSVVGLWFSGGIGWFDCGWCFWWQFFFGNFGGEESVFVAEF